MVSVPMLENKLTHMANAQPASRLVQEALAALLLKASSRDGDFGPEEVLLVISLLSETFGLDEDSTRALIKEAYALMEKTLLPDPFIKIIRDAYARESCIYAMYLLWRVVLTDGKVGKLESSYVSDVRIRLGLSEEDDHIARNAARAATPRIKKEVPVSKP